jgi:hypothetical protein
MKPSPHGDSSTSDVRTSHRDQDNEDLTQHTTAFLMGRRWRLCWRRIAQRIGRIGHIERLVREAA